MSFHCVILFLCSELPEARMGSGFYQHRVRGFFFYFPYRGACDPVFENIKISPRGASQTRKQTVRQAQNKLFSWGNLRNERVGVFTFRRSAKEGGMVVSTVLAGGAACD